MSSQHGQEIFEYIDLFVYLEKKMSFKLNPIFQLKKSVKKRMFWNMLKIDLVVKSLNNLTVYG